MAPQHKPNFLSRIGACGKCMREAFLAAAAALSGFALTLAIAASFGAPPFIVYFAATAAVALTLLWLTHVAVFALRAARAERSAEVKAEMPAAGRRGFVVGFAAAFAGAAVATMFAAPSANAQSDPWANYRRCNTSSCGGNRCCPARYPYLNLNDCECYESLDELREGDYYTYCDGACPYGSVVRRD